MTSGIYKITHLPTGRIYVGSSNNIERRWQAHQTALRQGRGNPKFRELGCTLADFAFEVVEEVQNYEQRLERERYWTEFLGSVVNGLNIRNNAFAPAPTATMAAPKKLASLRLEDDLLTRIDRLIELMYADLPVAPSRNAVLESWITSALVRAEADYGGTDGVQEALAERFPDEPPELN